MWPVKCDKMDKMIIKTQIVIFFILLILVTPVKALSDISIEVEDVFRVNEGINLKIQVRKL